MGKLFLQDSQGANYSRQMPISSVAWLIQKAVDANSEPRMHVVKFVCVCVLNRFVCGGRIQTIDVISCNLRQMHGTHCQHESNLDFAVAPANR